LGVRTKLTMDERYCEWAYSMRHQLAMQETIECSVFCKLIFEGKEKNRLVVVEVEVVDINTS
jgi:hypothetical protein